MNDAKVIKKEELYSSVVDFSKLSYKKGPLYSFNGRHHPESTATNSISDRVSLTSISFELVTELFAFEQLLESYKSDQFVVDVGCGEPALFNLMANSMFFPNYIGVDVRSSALEMFGNNSNCLVVESDITTESFIKDGTVDYVIFSEVLEHIDQNSGVELLKAIFKMLKPEGKLIFTAPIKPKQVDIDMDVEFDKWQHITYYEYDQLLELFNSIGFKIDLYSFNKFMGRRKTYKHVMNAFVNKYGEVGQEIWNRVASNWSRRVAASIFSHYAGDQMGHIQILASK